MTNTVRNKRVKLLRAKSCLTRLPPKPLPSFPVTYTFTTVGVADWVPPLVGGRVFYLVVGGGGGGGSAFDNGAAGGGGGGQVRMGCFDLDKCMVNAVLHITVGDGGNGGVAIHPANENNGSAGSFSRLVTPSTTITAYGGLGGGSSRFAPQDASGGFAATLSSGGTGGHGGGYNYGGGGGGGSAGDGGNGLPSLPVIGSVGTPGAGGAGTVSDLTGMTYGRGGTGGTNRTDLYPPLTNPIQNAPDNTGQGGEGASSAGAMQRPGAKGGSGIVILRYYV